MNYLGSKERIAHLILPIILKNRGVKPYIEVCSGGANSICKVDGERIAYDVNHYLIAMFKALQSGAAFTHDIPREYYNDVRDCYNKKTNKYSDELIGWVGYMASANGRFFEGGYAGVSQVKGGGQRNYIAEKIRNITKQIPSLDGVEFAASDFRNVEIKEQSVIYVDKPYEDTKQYSKECKNFPHDECWQWARDKIAEGHDVFVSEYKAPPDFVCVWQQEVKSSLSANGKSGGSKKSVEKLFVHIVQANNY